MDRISSAVLDKIHSISPLGRYAIVTEDELAEAIPEGFGEADVDKVLTELRNGGYIDVKYSRGDMYCIAPLKEYEEPLPGDDEPEESEVYVERRPKFNFTLLSAFIGGALGSLIISLIFAVI